MKKKKRKMTDYVAVAYDDLLIMYPENFVNLACDDSS